VLIPIVLNINVWDSSANAILGISTLNCVPPVLIVERTATVTSVPIPTA